MSTLLIEAVDIQSVENEILTEGASQTKNYYISGPFLEADKKNGNSRVYPKAVFEREVKRLHESKISTNRCLGELDHPEGTAINLDRVSHIIKELKMDNNIGIGKAMIIDTPMGKIAKNLIDAGVKLGVSTRGVGTLKESIVQNDFKLITIDIVADPSCQTAFMDSMMESKEWILENGILTEREIEGIIDSTEIIVVENKFSKEDQATAFIKVFNDIMNNIKAKHI